MERFCGMIQPLARSKVWIDESISNGLIYEMYLQMASYCRSSLSFEEMQTQSGIQDNKMHVENVDDTSSGDDDEIGLWIPTDPNDALDTGELSQEAEQSMEVGCEETMFNLKQTVYPTEFGTLRYSSVKELNKTHLRKLRQYYRTLYSPGYNHRDPISEHEIQFLKFIMKDEGDVVGSVLSLKKNEKVRNNSLIRYSMISDDFGTVTQYYGQVHFFLLHRYKDIDHCVCFVEYFPQVDKLYGFTRVDTRSIGQLASLDLNGGTAGEGLVGSKCEFINVGVIDCLIGAIRADDSNIWWVLDRTSDKTATYDLVVGDGYVN
jgi:hypothetical protein